MTMNVTKTTPFPRPLFGHFIISYFGISAKFNFVICILYKYKKSCYSHKTGYL